MNASTGRAFYYHADASPIGGHLTKPIKTVINTRGSASLAQAGGHAHRRTGSFRLKEILSVKQARSEIFGTVDKETGDWSTVTTSVIEGLNLLDTLKADTIASRLVVTHPRERRYPTVNFVGSQIENLTVAGSKVDIDFDLGQFSRGSEHGHVGDCPWAEERSFVERATEQHRAMVGMSGAPDWMLQRFGWMCNAEGPQQRGYVLCSLVKGLRVTPPNLTFGHVLHVPDFGNLFLGELLVYQHSYRLTMLRAELGCAAEGVVSFASDGSNGSPMP